MNICPSCKKPVTSLHIEDAPASAGIGRTTWKAITYGCPSCHAVLGCSIDPVALKTDIVREVKGR